LTVIVIPCSQDVSRPDPGNFSAFLQPGDDIGWIDVIASLIEDAANRRTGRIADMDNQTNLGNGFISRA
jgi:hypothetical protein